MSLQPNEILIIAVIALLLLGPNQLPGALRKFGKAVGEVKRMSEGFQREVRNAFEDAEEEAAARNAGVGSAKPADPVEPSTAEPEASSSDEDPDT